MKSIPAGQFKALCLELLDQVKERQQEYIITKRGEPYAKLTTVEPRHADPFGFLRGTVVDSSNILEPDGEAWGESKSDPLHSG
jgi:prevent-host-death family protein